MTKPDDVSQEDWDFVEGTVEAIQENRVDGKADVARLIMAARAEERYHILQLIKQEVSNVDEVNALFQAIRKREDSK